MNNWRYGTNKRRYYNKGKNYSKKYYYNNNKENNDIEEKPKTKAQIKYEKMFNRIVNLLNEQKNGSQSSK